MAQYLEARRDDERFAARLEEVNKEMDALLLKTTRTRHDLDRSAAEVRMGVPLHFFPQDVASRTGAPHPEGIAGSPQLHDALTRSVVTAELGQWVRSHLPGLVAPLVEAQVQQQLEKLRTTVDEVHARQVEVEKTTRDTAEQLRVHRRDQLAVFAAAQAETQRDRDAHERRLERQLAAFAEELRQQRDDLLQLQQRSSTAHDEHAQRITAALRRQEAQVQAAQEALRTESAQWRQAAIHDLQREAQAMQRRHDTLEQHVAQLQGMLTSATDTAAHAAVEVRRLMEDAVCRSSESRMCRRDVNRLEMLVQCAALQTTALFGEGGASNPGKTSAEHGAAAVAQVTGLAQEVGRLSDALHAVLVRVDGLGRSVRQLELGAQRGSGVGGTLSPYFGSVRGLDDESSVGRSLASTRRPSLSPSSAATTMRTSRAVAGFMQQHQQQHQQQTPSMYDDSGSNTPLQNAGSQTGLLLSAVSQPGWAGRGAPGVLASAGTDYHRHTAPAATAAPGEMPVAKTLVSAPHSAAPSHAPASHLSSSSLRFDDDPEELRSMPIVAPATRTAPGHTTVSGGSAVQRSGSATGMPRPAQHRSPPRVIPVGPVSAEAKPTAALAVPSAQDATVRRLLTLRDTEDAASVDPRRPSAASSRPSVPTSGSRRASNADTNRSGGSRASSLLHGSPGVSAVQEASAGAGASSPDTASSAAADSPVDSYVSDTPAADGQRGSDSARSADLPQSASRSAVAQYTPAQASDSESERDNHVMARSALD